jgi:hypothetical protein
MWMVFVLTQTGPLVKEGRELEGSYFFRSLLPPPIHPRRQKKPDRYRHYQHDSQATG